MTSPEARRRVDALIEEIFDSVAWDGHDPHRNPYTPAAKLDRLLECGAEAVEPLTQLLESGDENVREWAASGLGRCGAMSPAVALAALAAVAPGDASEAAAVASIARIDVDAYFALPGDRRSRTLSRFSFAIIEQLAVDGWLAAFLDRDDHAGAMALLDRLNDGARSEPVLKQVTRALESPSPSVRSKAAKVLSRTELLGPEERLEAMVIAGEPSSLERVAWHPRSDVLIPVLIAKGNVRWLVELVQRRRAAGLSTPVTPALFAPMVRALPSRVEEVRWALDQLQRRTTASAELGDEAFIRGSIDHTTACAFTAYAEALRSSASAVAAFQLAWIDRAFGAAITSDRVAWIRSLGLRDDALLNELSTKVVALEGYRFLWRKCKSEAQVQQALAAGLPGLAWTLSQSEAHQARAKEHVLRVHRGCEHERGERRRE